MAKIFVGFVGGLVVGYIVIVALHLIGDAILGSSRSGVTSYFFVGIIIITEMGIAVIAAYKTYKYIVRRLEK